MRKVSPIIGNTENQDPELASPQADLAELAAAPAEQAVARDFASKGAAALATGHLTTAAEAFRVALSQGGADVAASVYAAIERHADRAVALGRGSHAEACLGLLVALFPDRADARARAGQWLTQQGQVFEALGQLGAAASVYARLVALLPESEQALGLLHAAQRKLEEQASTDEIFDAALLAHDAGRLGEASDAWKRLIQRDVLEHRGVSVTAKLADALEGRAGSWATPAAAAPTAAAFAPLPASTLAPASEAPRERASKLSRLALLALFIVFMALWVSARSR